jgi:hypothetical protein
VHDIFSIIPHGGRVEASFSLGQNVISWRKSKTTDKTFPEKVVIRQYGRASNRILAGADSAFDIANTDNNSETTDKVEKSTLYGMAMVDDFLEMWLGRQNLHVTQKESHAQNKKITAIGYIVDIEEIVNASWSLFQHNGAAAFKLSERSTLPPALSAKDLLVGQT